MTRVTSSSIRELGLRPTYRVATGKARPFAFDQRRVTEQRTHARAIKGRRHDQKPQVLAQALLRVEREGEAEVGVERALVELVEQDGRHAVERGIGEDHAG